MNVLLWIVAGVLAVVFTGAGIMKATQPREKLAQMGLAWTEAFSPLTVKLIGTVNFMGGIGLILPAVFDIAPILVPLAASGIAVLMVLAAIVHARRKENQVIIGNVIIMLLALFVAWGRFGPYAF
ncbi:hypothetical protein Rhe02_44800 [Rhizocola hellebori]|uniref:DoxX family protein n=1 Tax=Rhizocola hellebori TaxID=1392758 RepID=A0A8J3QB12_9ACTN|nr:DoxX family protein [Rhizocola hellebori]GIH06413.1 hypothetical protein Rhe02_44800 [Rhizocola hellebori]